MMMEDKYYVTIKHVERGIFNKVSDRVYSEGMGSVIINYHGTQKYGDITIVGTTGNSKEFKRTVCILAEEYCK